MSVRRCLCLCVCVSSAHSCYSFVLLCVVFVLFGLLISLFRFLFCIMSISSLRRLFIILCCVYVYVYYYVFSYYLCYVYYLSSQCSCYQSCSYYGYSSYVVCIRRFRLLRSIMCIVRFLLFSVRLLRRMCLRIRISRHCSY